jgi:putative ATP-dependent endonuclease of OLD family
LHLDKLRLEQFRSFENGLISFHPYLTAIVGENNGGKSNIIDAIRLLFQPTSDRRDIYCREPDIRRGSEREEFRIKAKISGLNAAQRGLLVSAVPDPAKAEAIFGLEFKKEKGDRFRSKHWCGKFQYPLESGSSDLIKHVYLPPLRDAQTALASGDSARIVQLLRHFLDEDGEKPFVEGLRRDPAAATEVQRRSKEVLTSIKSSIDLLLRDLTTGAKEQNAALGFASDEKLHDVARDLKFKLAEAAIDPEDLRQSGLGYANLLFMATVIMELERSKDADLTLFLVEEPEAHLHPQLQMLVLDFLQEKAIASATTETEPGQPEGRIQVVVTSHSPNITAWIEPENLIVTRTVPVVDGRPKSLTLPVKDLGLSKRHLAKVSRYLDVTRSALLFGGRVMLIEGIAEALLLPLFVERMFPQRHLAGHSDRYKWKRFKSATIVAIDGVDFEPYVRLLMTSYAAEPESSSLRIADKVVVVTDRDPEAPGDREVSLSTVCAAIGAGQDVVIRSNANSFEKALFCPENEPILKAAFLDIHPKSNRRWEGSIESKEKAARAESFWKMFASKTNPIRKGDYAQALASMLSPRLEDQPPKQFQEQFPDNPEDARAAYDAAIKAFVIPDYIKAAIEDIVAINA